MNSKQMCGGPSPKRPEIRWRLNEIGEWVYGDRHSISIPMDYVLPLPRRDLGPSEMAPIWAMDMAIRRLVTEIAQAVRRGYAR